MRESAPPTTAPRSIWLESHLLNDPDGAEAHDAAIALGESVHGVLLRHGDRLATVSAVLAQSYYRRAAQVWRAFGKEGFLGWFDLGEGLATREPTCREGAIAFFSVPPAGFGEEGLRRAEEWCHLGSALAEISAKLAVSFLRTTPTMLTREDAMHRLRPWSTVAGDLYDGSGWQGEFLAQAYLRAAPAAPQVLHPQAYRLWAGAGAALHPSVRERDFFALIPPCLQEWDPDSQIALLRTVIALASVAPQQALLLYRDLPGAMDAFPPSIRGIVLHALQQTAHRHGAALAEIIPVVGPLVRQVPEALREPALMLVETLSRECPAVVVPAFRALPRLYEEAEPSQVVLWFEKGLELARQNLQAGSAYFGLESRTSLKILRSLSTTVSLEEVQGLLRKYVQMLSGEPATMRGVEPFSVRMPLEEFPAENEVAIPLRTGLLASHEDNLRLLRFVAAQLAGRREFGTYAFEPPGRKVGEEPEAPRGSAVQRYLDESPDGGLQEELFLLAEGYRVHARLCRAYRGLAPEAQWVAMQLLERWRQAPAASRSQWLDGVLLVAMAGGEPDGRPDWLVGEPAFTVGNLLRPLAAESATVQDSMRVAESLVLVISQSDLAGAGRRPELDGLQVDQLGVGTLYDPYLDDDGMPDGTAVQLQSAPEGSAANEVLEAGPTEVEQEPGDGLPGSQPISAEELQRLLDAGASLRITQGAGSEAESVGLYITDLIGKVPQEQIEMLRQLLGAPEDAADRRPKRWLDRRSAGASFWYDEWDYHIGDYRSRWCQLREISLDGDSGEFFNKTLTDYARLIPEVRRQFQRVRPEMYRTVRGLEDGDDFDLNAVVDASVDLHAGRAPTGKLYVARKREERDVATLFLVDMSASTDEPLEKPNANPAGVAAGSVAQSARDAGPATGRRIIDVTKEALVIMAEALDEIGDAYAIYGFSGHGRENVEFYRIKSFSEPLNVAVKSRLGGIEPKRSTRMGTALRHAAEKLAGVSSRSKHLFLLSDGFPQDFDYGQDRRNNVYGIRDTAVALREAETAGVTPFCLTVDKAGHDYLRQMCDESRYMVIEDIRELPRELPKVYQRVVRG